MNLDIPKVYLGSERKKGAMGNEKGQVQGSPWSSRIRLGIGSTRKNYGG